MTLSEVQRFNRVSHIKHEHAILLKVFMPRKHKIQFFFMLNSHKMKVFDFVFNLILFPFFFVDESNSNCKIKPIYSPRKKQISSVTSKFTSTTLLGLFGGIEHTRINMIIKISCLIAIR